jgi:hypothetical protein
MASMRGSNFPERFAAGIMLLNAGVGKVQGKQGDAGELHAAAVASFPAIDGIPPEQLSKILGASEMALGGALLLPFFGDGLAGAALTTFAAAMVSIDVRDPGLGREGGLLSRYKSGAIARDVWLLGIGLGLAADALRRRRRNWSTTL